MKEINEKLKEFSEGIKTMFKEFFNSKTNKRQRANMWTFSRLVISFIIPILMITKLYIPAIITTLLGSMTDFFDGRSARKYNSSSEFGKYLDMVSDKAFSIMIGLSLSIINPMIIVNLLLEVAIAITNIIYTTKYKNINIESSKIGKFKQWPLAITFVLGFLTTIFKGLSPITNISIIVSGIIQLITLNNYIISNNQKKNKLNEKIDNNIKINNGISKEKTLEKENNLSVSISKKEEYIKLRNILNEIIKITNNEQIENNPKIKTRK